jgi:hypothetical protein
MQGLAQNSKRVQVREAVPQAVPAWIDVGHCWQLASCPLGQDQCPLDSHTHAVHPF